MQRKTKQRDAILACFASAGRPLTPAEAHGLIASEHAALGIATVYRAINTFMDSGLLTSIVVAGVTRYELSNQAHHHHFFCEQCKRAFCIDNCPVVEERLAPKGFAVQGHDLVVLGLCPTCNQRESRPGS